MLRKLGQNYQIALPREIAKILHLHINDYLDIEVKDNKIIIEPQKLVPKQQVFFYSSKWQKEVIQAAQDIKTGKTTKTKNLKELFKELDK
ncbi:MAG: AbrB/MazE/SpoVT family DNA-binding domain-containing protein [Endomicrobiales bacterium]